MQIQHSPTHHYNRFKYLLLLLPSGLVHHVKQVNEKCEYPFPQSNSTTFFFDGVTYLVFHINKGLLFSIKTKCFITNAKDQPAIEQKRK